MSSVPGVVWGAAISHPLTAVDGVPVMGVLSRCPGVLPGFLVVLLLSAFCSEDADLLLLACYLAKDKSQR